MKCNNIEQKAVEYADGTLDAKERAALEAHTKTCPKCAQTLSATISLFNNLKSTPTPDPGDIFWKKFNDTIHTQIKTATPAPHRRHNRTPSRIAAAAAILLLSLGIYTPLHNKTPGPGKHTASIPQSATASHEEEILLAAISSSADVPLFESIYQQPGASGNETEYTEQEIMAYDEAGYGAPPSSVYDIPSHVNTLTEEEAGKILNELPALQESGT